MPSVREIAKYAGVSTSTVSLALNNKQGISEVTRRRVLEALYELQGREAVRAGTNSHLAETKMGEAKKTDAISQISSVVVLHPAILRSSQVFSELLQGIQAAAIRYQIQLNLAVNEENLPQSHVTRLYLSDEALRPDGVLVIGARMHEPLVEEMRKLGLPVVLLGRQAPDTQISAVGRDEVGITIEAMNSLFELGHQAIALVGGDLSYSYTHARLHGYREALAEQGITVPERWIALGPGDAAARKIVENSPEITAVLCINDAYAMQALPVFQNAGRKIPENLSVISFDNTTLAQTFDPPLTSISYPRFQEGFWALKMLVEQAQQPLMLSSQITSRSTLIKRASCAPPNREVTF